MGLLKTGRKVAAKAVEPAARTFQDYLSGVAKVHKDIATIPGAQRVDPKLREAQAAMNPKQVLEQYNENQLFGTTAKGEPLRGVIQDRSAKASNHQSNYKLHEEADLPDKGRFMLFPESKLPQDLSAGTYLVPQMDFYKKLPYREDADYAASLAKALTGQSNPRAMDPRMFNIYAMGVTPPSTPGTWTEGLRSRGKEMYGALYDMMRAGGHGNFADTLTPVNSVRRLGNVGSHAVGHGNFGYISPLDESIGYTTGVPGMRLRSNPHESEYLDSLFLTGLRPGNRQIVEDINAIAPSNYGGLTDQDRLGLLYLREAQLSGVYGPPTQGGQLTRISEMSPSDAEGLRALAEPYVLSSPGNLPGAFGPSTLGRQLTTESVIRRMMKGESPDEISYQLLRDAPAGGYKGRYKKGGLVRAAIES